MSTSIAICGIAARGGEPFVDEAKSSLSPLLVQVLVSAAGEELEGAGRREGLGEPRPHLGAEPEIARREEKERRAEEMRHPIKRTNRVRLGKSCMIAQTSAPFEHSTRHAEEIEAGVDGRFERVVRRVEERSVGLFA